MAKSKLYHIKGQCELEDGIVYFEGGMSGVSSRQAWYHTIYAIRELYKRVDYWINPVMEFANTLPSTYNCIRYGIASKFLHNFIPFKNGIIKPKLKLSNLDKNKLNSIDKNVVPAFQKGNSPTEILFNGTPIEELIPIPTIEFNENEFKDYKGEYTVLDAIKLFTTGNISMEELLTYSSSLNNHIQKTNFHDIDSLEAYNTILIKVNNIIIDYYMKLTDIIISNTNNEYIRNIIAITDTVDKINKDILERTEIIEDKINEYLKLYDYPMYKTRTIIKHKLQLLSVDSKIEKGYELYKKDILNKDNYNKLVIKLCEQENVSEEILFELCSLEDIVEIVQSHFTNVSTTYAMISSETSERRFIYWKNKLNSLKARVEYL